MIGNKVNIYIFKIKQNEVEIIIEKENQNTKNILSKNVILGDIRLP
tara:strand:- start:211 stop:348 length:138 start_codon:yes stop_codon:yes gene_type:complete